MCCECGADSDKMCTNCGRDICEDCAIGGECPDCADSNSDFFGEEENT